nr:ABC transporter ATP-binding protein [uncultured Eisenbergiella sp.]
MSKFRQVIKKILYILNRPQKFLCLMVFFLTCVGAVFECLSVSVIIPLVNIIVDPKIVGTSSLLRGIPFVTHMDYAGIVAALVGGIIFLYLIKNGFFIFLSWVRIKFSCKIQREVSIRMMESYMSRGYQYFLKRDMGELNRGVNSDTVAVYSVLYAGFRLLSDLLTISLICLFMIFSDWMLSLMMLFMAFICVLLIYIVFRKNMHKAGVQGRDYMAKASQTLYEAFQGIKDILVLRKQHHFVVEYEKNQIQVQLAQCKQIVGQESPAYIIEGLCVSGLMVAVAFRIVLGEQSVEFVAVLAAFAVGAFRILPSLGRISMALNQVVTSMPSVSSVYDNIVEADKYELLHPELKFGRRENVGLIAHFENREDYMREYAVELQYSSKPVKEINFQEQLFLSNITFSYGKGENILENVSLKIKKGQSIAFIGSSGAGKSTLVDILLGLLVPQEGGVFIDGHAIVDIPETWANIVGYVPQTVFLLSGSIKDNVAFGECLEDIDEKRVKDALERAELSDFIRSLPRGIDTKVGDRGVRLSGGQRQRIAIARALYHQPEIMVLDEATSALDNDTEAAIMSAIDALQGQITLIIVAHRLTTVKNCDVIYEVKDKGIIERNKLEIFGK